MGLYKATKISRTPSKASKDMESKQQQKWNFCNVEEVVDMVILMTNNKGEHEN